MENLPRNNSIDILRLVACIAVIFLHIQYGDANQTFVAIIRLMCRWAVPFFFLTSGYFFQKGLEKAPSKTFKKTFFKIFCILIVADIAYFPLGHFPTIWYYLIQGNSIHLWFLHSMLLGIIIVYSLHLLKIKQYLSIIIALIMLGIILITGSYSFIIGANSINVESYTRTLLSIPLMLIGTYFYANKDFVKLLNKKTGLIFFFIGCILQIIEVVVINIYTHRSIMNHQFLIGTLFLSMGIFILANTINLKNEMIGQWGINYSLFIYIYHPRWISLLKIISYNLYLNNISIFILPVLIFTITLLLAIFIDKYLHRLYLIMTGSIKLAFK